MPVVRYLGKLPCLQRTVFSCGTSWLIMLQRYKKKYLYKINKEKKQR